jgi:hypothetical protein
MRAPLRTLALAAALCAAGVAGALAHDPHATQGAPDDGHVTMRWEGSGGTRVWRLQTRDDRAEVRIYLVAQTEKSHIEVRISDPDGREVANLVGSGRLDVDSGPFRLVDGRAGKGEGRRGTWQVEVETATGSGSYTLSWWGLAPPAGAGGEPH